MTVVITRDVPDRFRGFLRTIFSEIAPGVFTAPRISQAVRNRIWKVMEAWHRGYDARAGTVLMIWPDEGAAGGQEIRSLGIEKVRLVEHEGLLLVKR
jgi:CRISPR-associated protein Cas2